MRAISVAKYYLLRDVEGSLYDEVKLNKCLFITQIFYILKKGDKLFEEDFEVYRGVPIVDEVRFPASKIITWKNDDNLSLDIKDFLEIMYNFLRELTPKKLDALVDAEPTLKVIRDDNFLMPIINFEENQEKLEKIYMKWVGKIFGEEKNLDAESRFSQEKLDNGHYTR